MVRSRVWVSGWRFCVNMLELFLDPWIQEKFLVMVMDLGIPFELGF
jgi:hypothetical protein